MTRCLGSARLPVSPLAQHCSPREAPLVEMLRHGGMQVNRRTTELGSLESKVASVRPLPIGCYPWPDVDAVSSGIRHELATREPCMRLGSTRLFDRGPAHWVRSRSMRRMNHSVCNEIPENWRRGGDSNPRCRLTPHNRLATWPVRPLRHLSAAGTTAPWAGTNRKKTSTDVARESWQRRAGRR